MLRPFEESAEVLIGGPKRKAKARVLVTRLSLRKGLVSKEGFHSDRSAEPMVFVIVRTGQRPNSAGNGSLWVVDDEGSKMLPWKAQRWRCARLLAIHQSHAD